MSTESNGPTKSMNFDEYYVKSMARQAYKKRDYGLAEKYLEKMLEIPDGDTCETRTLLSTCQRLTFKTSQAQMNQARAEMIDPTSLSVIENGAKLLFDVSEYEKSYIKFDEGVKRASVVDKSKLVTFTEGKETADYTIDEALVCENASKYGSGLLGAAVKDMAKQGDLRTLIKESRMAMHGHANRKRELFYLRDLAQEKKFYDKLLKSIRAEPPSYDKDVELIGGLENVVDAFQQTLHSLYTRKPLYIYWSEEKPLHGVRHENKIKQDNIKKNTVHEQIFRYVESVEKLISEGKITEAMKKAELMVDYKNKKLYKPKKLFHQIFQRFGAVLCSKFQDLDKWTEEENHQRIEFLFGARKGTLKLRESLFGRNHVNPRLTITKLMARVQNSKCSMEKMFLNFEIARCYLQQGIDHLETAQVHMTECYKLADKMNCHSYILISTVLMGLIEFRLGFKRKTLQGLTIALKYARSINAPGIIKFVEKMLGMIDQIEPLVITPRERYEQTVLKCVPKVKKNNAKVLLNSIREQERQLTLIKEKSQDNFKIS